MPSYICVGPFKCQACSAEHPVHLDFSKAHPDQRLKFVCPATKEEVTANGYQREAFTLVHRLPSDAIVGEMLDD